MRSSNLVDTLLTLKVLEAVIDARLSHSLDLRI